MDSFLLLVRIALRNLTASRLKTFIVGGIVLFGAFIVTVGNSLVESITAAMSRSIIGSASGDIQVYSARSKDAVELFGGFMEPDLAQVDDFARVKKSLEALPNVKEVVPMGVSGALVTSGNTVDVVLERLRNAVRKTQDGDTSPAALAEVAAQRDHAHQIISVLERDQKNLLEAADDKALSKDDAAAIARATSPEFWAGFDEDPLAALEFLENKIAPLVTDADLLFLRYIGTDPAQFARSFDRLQVVDGQAIPEGKRGILLAKQFYEKQCKLRTARRFDDIKEAMDVNHRRIVDDKDLQRMVKENTTQTREILLQLDAPKSRLALERIRKELGVTDGDLPTLLPRVLGADDATFARRYDFFYRELAPLLELYRIRVGDTMTIKAFTKTGYMQSVTLRVYGTFNFQGLEKSALSGALSLMDLVSFRELYGFLTAERTAEIEKIKGQAGIKDVSRENAEAELFGDGKQVVAEATPGLMPDLPDLGGGGGAGAALRRREMLDRVYGAEELQRGVVLNAAVILKDPRRLRETMRDIEATSARDGLELKVASWQDAAGLIGKLVTVFRGILTIAVLIIFLVALVIINNALVMAALERVREIGTLRAVGAQRTFILGMLVVEALVIGAVFGTAGAALGALVVAGLHKVGIAATTDVMFFFFSGPRLHPTLGSGTLIVALVIVLLVSGFSSIYPALLAMRVTPRQAMASED